jgi:hypothetical protein
MPHLDAGLADGDGLLLHGLVDGHLVAHIHLVKLVNAADAVVRQHQRASLNRKLATLRVLAGSGRGTKGQQGTASVTSVTKSAEQQYKEKQTSNGFTGTARPNSMSAHSGFD